MVRERDPELPISDAVAMEDVVADSMAHDRFLMLLLVGFAVVALVLALVGVYGVTAQAARQRLVAAALTATRAMAGLLYGIMPNDPATFLTVSWLVIAAGLGASWHPARRAARLDPAATLRAE